MATAIELEGLTKRYGTFTAVDGLNLSIEQGEIFGLLGPNGAGKSTTILMMLGLTEPTAGRAKVCGLDPVRDSIAVKRRVGYLPDDVGFYDQYSGLDNLLYTARLNGLTAKEADARARHLLQIVGLSAEANKKTGKYSRGMRQRLGLADVLIKNPEVIILDEPTLGIDPQGVKELLELIVSLSRQQGITVLLCSHHLHQVQQVCDRVGIFVKGKLLASGNLNQLSEALFGEESETVELNINGGPDEYERLLQVVNQMDGIRSASWNAGRLFVRAGANSAPALARCVVAAGFQLCHLAQRSYGLDEIYQRYFEGGN